MVGGHDASCVEDTSIISEGSRMAKRSRYAARFWPPSLPGRR